MVIDSSSVSLSMSCGSYGVESDNPFYYDLQYTSASNGVPIMKTVPVVGGGPTIYTLSDLPEDDYVFRLNCRNDFGSSPLMSKGPVHLNGEPPLLGLITLPAIQAQWALQLLNWVHWLEVQWVD